MILLAITGGIGSGKTIVSRLFETYGVPVYNSDEQAKHIMNTNREVRAKIETLFGKKAYENNALNRKYVSTQVFTTPALLQQLNAIVHPAVCADLREWANRQNKYIVAVETAVLMESGLIHQVDKVLTVTAPDQLRETRAAQRDQSTIEAVKQRMANQTPQSELMAHSDYIINNDIDQALLPQVADIMKTIY